MGIEFLIAKGDFSIGKLIGIFQQGTAGPRLTRILGPEKNRVRRNRTIGGLWDYTI